MDIESIKERLQPKAYNCTCHGVGVSITMPSLEEVGWLISEHDRLTAQLAAAQQENRELREALEKISDNRYYRNDQAQIAREALQGRGNE